jgi:hypothetical protein
VIPEAATQMQVERYRQITGNEHGRPAKAIHPDVTSEMIPLGVRRGQMKRAPKKLPPLPVRAAHVLARLKHLRGVHEGEKSLHALGVAATPQERWELCEQRVRSFGYWTPSKRNKAVTQSSAWPLPSRRAW